MGFVVPIDAVAQELATENAAYASIPAIADVTSQKGLEASGAACSCTLLSSACPSRP